MIDIHSHIVFDVDDGPKTIEDSKLLIEVRGPVNWSRNLRIWYLEAVN